MERYGEPEEEKTSPIKIRQDEKVEIIIIMKKWSSCDMVAQDVWLLFLLPCVIKHPSMIISYPGISF